MTSASIIVAPTVAYMDVRAGLAQLGSEVREVDVTDTSPSSARAGRARPVARIGPRTRCSRNRRPPRLCAFALRTQDPQRGRQHALHRLLQRPLGVGADVVIHSATKAIGGHSGLAPRRGRHEDRDRHAQLQEVRTVTGATPGALEVFLCLRGLRTLPLRLERAQHNATVLAYRLSEHPAVSDVRYPSLNSHPSTHVPPQWTARASCCQPSASAAPSRPTHSSIPWTDRLRRRSNNGIMPA